jgi:S1-C subfamily serine protease
MTQLSQLSQDLAALVAAGSPSVVRIDGRRGASASGTVWSADGVIVATHHAVDDDEVELGMPDGRAVKAEVVGRDPSTDLAILRAAEAGLQPPPWADDGAPIAPGELLVSLSRPGRAVRADLGLVARVAGEQRVPAGGRLDRYVEAGLALQPGLSGSLVLSAAGPALGIATAGLLRGTALVVPVATLRRVVKALLAHGGIRRGYLGITSSPVALPPAAAAQHGQAGALLISGVEQGSPADRAGLLLGDVLLALGGAAVESPRDLAPALEAERIGDAVAVRLLRAGAPLEVTLTIGAREPRPRAGHGAHGGRCG